MKIELTTDTGEKKVLSEDVTKRIMALFNSQWNIGRYDDPLELIEDMLDDVIEVWWEGIP